MTLRPLESTSKFLGFLIGPRAKRFNGLAPSSAVDQNSILYAMLVACPLAQYMPSSRHCVDLDAADATRGSCLSLRVHPIVANVRSNIPPGVPLVATQHTCRSFICNHRSGIS